MPDEFQEHDQELVAKAISDLMIHFDAVQIFATRVEGGITTGCSNGAGNFYARLGIVGTWMEDPTNEEDEIE